MTCFTSYRRYFKYKITLLCLLLFLNDCLPSFTVPLFISSSILTSYGHIPLGTKPPSFSPYSSDTSPRPDLRTLYPPFPVHLRGPVLLDLPPLERIGPVVPPDTSISSTSSPSQSPRATTTDGEVGRGATGCPSRRRRDCCQRILETSVGKEGRQGSVS